MSRHTDFKRMLLGLPPSTADYEMVRLTARLAELLQVNLIGMFAEDRNLIDIAGLPCVRELRALEGGWRPIEIGQFTAELHSAAATAHRLFSDIVRNCGVETSFRIEEGSAADAISTLATPEDIVVVIEPRHPIERVSQQFTRLINVAFQASAAVMIIPRRVVRFAGPIVAVAAEPNDPSISTAMAIAAAAHEKLIVVSQTEIVDFAASLSVAARSANVQAELARVRKGTLCATLLADDLRRVSERLIVISRGTLADVEASTLALMRSAPIVIIEPLRSDNAGIHHQ